MKATIRSVTLVGSMLVAMSPTLFADSDTVISAHEDAKALEETFDSVVPEGRTLPANIVRARIVTKSITGDKSYNKDGRSADSTFKPDVLATGFVVDLGITNKLTGRIMVPYFFRNDLNTDDPMASKFMESKGNTGIGDMEVGALYNFLHTDNVLVSAGLGARFATGRYSDVPMNVQAAGFGYNDLGLRLNLDYQPVTNLWLSLQDQEEIAVSAAERKLGAATSKSVKFDKKGLSRYGFAQAAYGFGAVASSLKAFNVKGRYAYSYDARQETKGVEVKPSSFVQYVGAGAGVDGRAYSVPVAFDAYYQMPVAAKNTSVALKTLELTLSTYFQI